MLLFFFHDIQERSVENEKEEKKIKKKKKRERRTGNNKKGQSRFSKQRDCFKLPAVNYVGNFIVFPQEEYCGICNQFHVCE